MDGLPCFPAMIDVAQVRRAEPNDAAIFLVELQHPWYLIPADGLYPPWDTAHSRQRRARIFGEGVQCERVYGGDQISRDTQRQRCYDGTSQRDAVWGQQE